MWIYNNKPYDPKQSSLNDVKGFVYRITDTETGQFYIGQKVFWNKRIVQATKKKKKHSKYVESDWRKYASSSDVVKQQYANTPDRFKREILFIAINKAEMNYVECFNQMLYGVLLTEQSYNGMINIRQGKKGLERLVSEGFLSQIPGNFPIVNPT